MESNRGEKPKELKPDSRGRRAASLGAWQSAPAPSSAASLSSASQFASEPPAIEIPRSSTGLTQVMLGAAKAAYGSSSDKSSPGRESPRVSPGRDLISEEERKRRTSSSPRRGILVSSHKSGSPRPEKTPTSSTNSSPRSPSPSPYSSQKSSGSPRTSIAANESDASPIPSTEIPMVLLQAQTRYAAQHDVEKLKAEKIKKGVKLSEEQVGQLAINNRAFGYSYMHAPAGGAKSYPIIVTGNIPSGSNVFILDFNRPLGDGCSGKVFVGYELSSGKRVAIKLIKEVAGISSILREINHLFVAEDLYGFYRGPLALPEGLSDKEEKAKEGKTSEENNTVAIVMPLVPGDVLTGVLYETASELKTDINYKDNPKYYKAKKQISYSDRLAMAEAAIDALDTLHNKGLLHQDISPDNILPARVANGYMARFIDYEAAAKVGCELLKMKEKPTKENLILGEVESIQFKTDSVYIRFDQQLFYLHRERKTLVEINVSAEVLQAFDQAFQPDEKRRLLSRAELQRITKMTAHTLLSPTDLGINALYGFAPPESSKRAQKTYESDFYSLGVLIVFILSGKNLMHDVKEDFSEMIKREKGHRKEFSPDDLKRKAADIFSDEEFVYDFKKHHLHDFVYHHFILPQLRIHLMQLLAEEPAMRLVGSSLKELKDHLSALRSQHNKLCEALSNIVDGLNNMQNVPLPQVLLVIQGFSRVREKRNYLLGQVDSILQLQEAASVVDDSGDDIVLASERVNKQLQKRALLTQAIGKISKGWKMFEGDLVAIKPLIESLCASGADAFQFLTKLSSIMPAGEKGRQEEKRHAINPMK